MKKLLTITAVLICVFSTANAQVSINVNIGTPPVWAPADRVEVQYYYLPDIDVYYDVPQARFIYLSNGSWIRSVNLPPRCRNYNLHAGHVVYLTDYRGTRPYAYHKRHKVKYFTGHPERVVAYREVKYHKHHDRRNGKNRGHGNGKKDH